MAPIKPKMASSKRKRDEKSEKPRKRAKSPSGSKTTKKDNEQDRILLLETDIYQSKKNYNNIVTLLEIAKTIDPTTANNDTPEFMAVVVLCRVFIRLLSQGGLTTFKGQSPKDATVVQWLRTRYDEYKGILLALLRESAETAPTVLTLCMTLLKADGNNMYKRDEDGEAKEQKEEPEKKERKGKQTKETKEDKETKEGAVHYFPHVFLDSIVQALLRSRRRFGNELSESLIDSFGEEWVGPYDDVRFYTLKAMATALPTISSETAEDEDEDEDTNGETAKMMEAAFDVGFYMLSQIQDVPTSNDDLDSFYVQKPQRKNHPVRMAAQHRAQMQRAWVALLQWAKLDRQRKAALDVMATEIAPWFVQPELLLDFLADCYDAGGATSLLALSGLYYLIRERNVDYPAFYRKLYSLLDGALLHSKHRARFFRLLDEFLASSHLPSQLVASFVKRLARLCLFAPPSAIVSVVPWIYNIMVKHPLCTFMMHRVPRTDEERDRLARDGLLDCFLPLEPDPMETYAIDSSLWEIVQLQSHYHPNVASIAKIISEQFTKQSYNIEDFLDHSYQSMIDNQLQKEVKRTPEVEFQIPKHIFLPNDPDAAEKDKLLVKLWDFA